MNSQNIKKDIFSKVAVDHTTMLSAQSAISSAGTPDPNSVEDFVDLVDLFINADSLYLTLPEKNMGQLELENELYPYCISLSDAKIPLASSAEELIADEFTELCEQWRYLPKWLEFQFVNDLVTREHIGKKKALRFSEIISEEGRSEWNRLKLDGEFKGREFRFGFLNQMTNEYRHESLKFRSKQSFALCYAYDIFRRGAQYYHKVLDTSADIHYFPPEIRRPLLELNQKEYSVWTTNFNKRVAYWSWGNYLLEVIKENKLPINGNPKIIAKYIIAIKESMKVLGGPVWCKFDPDSSPSYYQACRALVDVASRAELPLLRANPQSARDDLYANASGVWGPALASLLVSMVSKELGELLGYATGAWKVAPWLVKQFNREAAEKLEIWTVSTEREVQNFFFKSFFGYELYNYRGLLVNRQQRE